MNEIRWHRYKEPDFSGTVFAISIPDVVLVNSRTPRLLIFWKMVKLAFVSCFRKERARG